MVEIGGKPILWHIMKIYSHFGFNEFIILCGYKGYMIKEYFSNYYSHMSDMTVDMTNNTITHHANHAEPWKVTLVDTGLESMTGRRIKKVKDYVGKEPFMLTYGDGVGDINIPELVKYHKSHVKAITMTLAPTCWKASCTVFPANPSKWSMALVMYKYELASNLLTKVSPR